MTMLLKHWTLEQSQQNVGNHRLTASRHAILCLICLAECFSSTGTFTTEYQAALSVKTALGLMVPTGHVYSDQGYIQITNCTDSHLDVLRNWSQPTYLKNSIVLTTRQQRMYTDPTSASTISHIPATSIRMRSPPRCFEPPDPVKGRPPPRGTASSRGRMCLCPGKLPQHPPQKPFECEILMTMSTDQVVATMCKIFQEEKIPGQE